MYPKQLLSEVHWGFYGGRRPCQEEFIQEVTEYNKELNKEWNPNDTVLNYPNVTILYSYWNTKRNNVEEKSFDLAASNQSGFTAGELMYKIHNQVVDRLENEDFRFFEGLTLWKIKNEKNIHPKTPLYFINQTDLKYQGGNIIECGDD